MAPSMPEHKLMRVDPPSKQQRGEALAREGFPLSAEDPIDSEE